MVFLWGTCALDLIFLPAHNFVTIYFNKINYKILGEVFFHKSSVLELFKTFCRFDLVYVGHILGIFLACIKDILYQSLAYLELSLGISWAYLWHLLFIYYTYLCHIFNIYWVCSEHILTRVILILIQLFKHALPSGFLIQL